MILYLDTSALVKRYIAELGTPEVAAVISDADVVGTSIISRAETAAVLAKAVRTRMLSPDEAASALQVFRSEWPSSGAGAGDGGSCCPRRWLGLGAGIARL